MRYGHSHIGLATVASLSILMVTAGMPANSESRPEIADARAAIAQGDYPRAVAKFQQAAELGDPDAESILGAMYDNGLGVPIDKEKAFPLLLKAAEQGKVDSQFRVAMAYSLPMMTYGRPKKYPDWNPDQSTKWFNKAAEGAVPLANNGDPLAEGVLGMLYYYGRGGIPSDRNKAFEWTRKAAEQGVPLAQDLLSRFYAEGLGVPIDLKKAREWTEKAAQAGLTGSQTSLAGFLLKDGDLEGAKLLYVKAALLGDAVSSSILQKKYHLEVGDHSAVDAQAAAAGVQQAIREENKAATKYTDVAGVAAILTFLALSAATESHGPGGGDVGSGYSANQRTNMNDNLDRMRQDQMRQDRAQNSYQQQLWRESNERAMDDMRRSQDLYNSTHR